jgi:hypothetical protein
MAAHDLYGIVSEDIEKAKDLLEDILQVTFEGRESSYIGEYYIHKRSDGERFKLIINKDPLDSSPQEANFSEYLILLYVKNTNRSTDLQQIISKVTDKVILLRHRES